MNPHQRPANLFRDRSEMGRELGERCRHRRDEFQCWPADRFFIPFAIRREPRAIVVPGQLAEKLYQISRKALKGILCHLENAFDWKEVIKEGWAVSTLLKSLTRSSRYQ